MSALPWVKLLELAANAANGWNNERKARKAILQVFAGHFLDHQGKVALTGEVEVANLVFTVSGPKQNAQSKFHDVMVVNTHLTGDDPRRTRTFRFIFYWPHGSIIVAYPPMYFLHHSIPLKP